MRSRHFVDFIFPLARSRSFQTSMVHGIVQELKLNVKDSVSADMFTFDKCQLKPPDMVWNVNKPHLACSISSALKQACPEHMLQQLFLLSVFDLLTIIKMQ